MFPLPPLRQLDWTEESGASPADQRGRRGEVSQRPQESEPGPAGPPSSPGGEPYVGTAEAPDQVTFQRNRFRLPPQRADAERGMLGDEEPASERHTEQLLLSGEPH